MRMKIIVAAAVLLMPAPALAFDGLVFAFTLAGAALPALAAEAHQTQSPAAGVATVPARNVSQERTPARFASSRSRQRAGMRNGTIKRKTYAHRVAATSPVKIRR
ncbi:hypothetical protein [Salinarimonas soli]|uniref:Antifreeze protein n=1 Tax=Salinarimonas soli TaxID=1638099 RepID=A0A5B2VBT7_9HYPH|nr:hypothetical protein [Salinarimonas soli]KAA2235930.1 hypothetical protein F0L46_17350 [Salinarimonas soli]